jgi:hypothetical protein
MRERPLNHINLTRDDWVIIHDGGKVDFLLIGNSDHGGINFL